MKPARLGEAGGCRERQHQGFWLAELDGGQSHSLRQEVGEENQK